MNNNRYIKHLDFIISDILALQLALFFARQFRKDTFIYLNDNYTKIALYILCTYVFITLFWNVYSGILLRNFWNEIKNIIALNAGVFVSLMMYFFASKTSITYSRVVMTLFPILSCVLMFFFHIPVKYFNKYIVKKTVAPFYLLVNSFDAEYCIRNFINNDMLHEMRGIILFDSVDEQYICGYQVMGVIDDLRETITEKEISCVYAYGAGEKLEDIMELLALKHIPVYKILRPLHKSSIIYKVEKISNSDVLSIMEKEIPLGLAIIKRISDIIFSILCLILTMPLCILVAIVIKVNDGGKVIYVADRVGLDGKKIKMYKFRTMKSTENGTEILDEVEMADFYHNGHKLKDDPRITSVGRFLRKYSIDEIPQFINILKGDMSFVGPRPVSEEETYYYGEKRNLFLSVKPGLTGYWQTHGRSNVTYENNERQNMELFYIENFSWYMDIKILILTIYVVLSGDGAM